MKKWGGVDEEEMGKKEVSYGHRLPALPHDGYVDGIKW